MRRVISLFLPSWPTDRLTLGRVRLGRSKPDTLKPDKLEPDKLKPDKLKPGSLHLHGDAPPETPVIVAAREGSRRLVTAVDAAARALGITPGMAVAKAQAMQPGLCVMEADPAGDAAGLKRLAAWCLRQVSPLAAPDAPDGVWIDVTGAAHLFGGEAALLDWLTRRLAQGGIAARAALADTPGAAHALARFGAAPCHVDPPGGAAASLAPLPVAALRLDRAVVEALNRLGFESVGQLMAAPRAPLVKRFGGAVTRRLDQALGTAREPIEPLLSPDVPRARLSFAEPIATAEDLARAAALLTERVCAKLLRLGLGARQLDLVFTRVDGASQTLRVGTSAATRDAGHIMRLLRDRLETVDPGFGIEAAYLAATQCDTLGARQAVSDLAAVRGNADLSLLVDTLANRLGGDRVFRLAPVESDVPERSVRRVPPLEANAAADWPDDLPRPARLISPPQRVRVLALLPDHAPKNFVWRDRSYRVRCADGPERIFGEWWRGASERAAVRDYFSVEDEDGQRFWLYREGNGEDPATGSHAWYLHGLFA
jgi:protein ImuB